MWNNKPIKTERNTIGPHCPQCLSVGRRRADRPRARRPAGPPAALQTTTDDDDDRRQPAKQYWPVRRASNN